MMKYSWIACTSFLIAWVPLYAQSDNIHVLQPQEFMHPDSLYLFGTIPIDTSVSVLIDSMGAPDSVIAYDQERCTSYFVCEDSSDHRSIYWGETEAEACGTKASFESFRFESNPDLYLIYAGRIKLSSKTTVDSLKQYYPHAMENLGEIKVYQHGTYDSVTLPVTPVKAESGFMLFFRNEHLARIDYWFPC